MSPQELQSAWDETRQFFRECPTCRQIVCIPDFDEPTGFCDEASPRAAEVEAAKAQQAAQAWKGIADVFGVTGAIQKGMAQASAQSSAQADAAQATCSADGTKAPAGTKFCPNCGAQMTQPTAASPGGTASTCASLRHRYGVRGEVLSRLRDGRRAAQALRELWQAVGSRRQVLPRLRHTGRLRESRDLAHQRSTLP